MKKVIAAENLLDKNILLAPSEDETVQIMEIEDEEFDCEGCAADFVAYGEGFTQEFIWHPSKKF